MKMEKERLWNANYNKVMFSNFALNFSFYVLTPLLPLYLSEHFAATKDVIGLVLSGYTITALLFRPFSGYIVDTFSRKAVLLFCLLLNVVFFLGYLAASTLLLFTIVRTMHGAPFGGATVANSTIAIDVLPSSRRNEGIGFYGISNNIATAIAPTIGISVYKMTGNFEMLFWMAFVVAFLGLSRPVFPLTGLDACSRHRLLRTLLRHPEQLPRHLRQRTVGHHQRHRHLFHAPLLRSYPLPSAGSHRAAQRTPHP